MSRALEDVQKCGIHRWLLSVAGWQHARHSGAHIANLMLIMPHISIYQHWAAYFNVCVCVCVFVSSDVVVDMDTTLSVLLDRVVDSSLFQLQEHCTS